jgi:hypothetical protein
MAMEEWRRVVGFPEYEVSNLGNVRSWKVWNGRQRPLPHPMVASSVRGYLVVSISSGETRVQKKTYALVLEAFVGPRPDGMQGCHNNGDKSDNRLDNLRWDTAKANHADKLAHGTTARGDRHGSRTKPESVPRGTRNGWAKLDDEKVADIRRRVAADESKPLIAALHGVALCTIYRVAKRERWAHAG